MSNILCTFYPKLHFYTVFSSADRNNKIFIGRNIIFYPISQCKPPSPISDSAQASGAIIQVHAQNNNKVANRSHVEFKIFTKLGIFGPLGPLNGQISGTIGPVLELSWHLTHILLLVKYQIDCINKLTDGQENLC